MLFWLASKGAGLWWTAVMSHLTFFPCAPIRIWQHLNQNPMTVGGESVQTTPTQTRWRRKETFSEFFSSKFWLKFLIEWWKCELVETHLWFQTNAGKKENIHHQNNLQFFLCKSTNQITGRGGSYVCTCDHLLVGLFVCWCLNRFPRPLDGGRVSNQKRTH